MDAFRENPSLFKRKLEIEKASLAKWITLIGEPNPDNAITSNSDWLTCLISLEDTHDDVTYALTREIPAFKELSERGFVSPFLYQLAGIISDSNTPNPVLAASLEAQSEFFEQVSRRAVTLELNVASLSGELKGQTSEDRFLSFIEKFRDRGARAEFFKKYPVLARAFHERAKLWEAATFEFHERLSSDRDLLQISYGIPRNATLRKMRFGGDKHNSGRVVTIVEFSSGHKVIYKPRSVSIEAGFQNYLQFFNSKICDFDLKVINVKDRGNYGWVEFVENRDSLSVEDSVLFYKKLGFLLGLVHSIGGVDVFFENLISDASDPVIIDLESMFHSFIDHKRYVSPKERCRARLQKSVAGIGILPSPVRGDQEEDIFDISVMGAKEQAKAPYKVPGVENFGKDNMRIGVIPGWIPETKATSQVSIEPQTAALQVFAGLDLSFRTLRKFRDEICVAGGVLDSSFSKTVRRLIVRDTTVYGFLQLDEFHPDLIKDQVSHELYLDNLWRDLLHRPQLSHFISSELAQMNSGDIPYFSGPVSKSYVNGGDGTKLDLLGIDNKSPLERVRGNIEAFGENEANEQLRYAATALSLKNSRTTLLSSPDTKTNARSLLRKIMHDLCYRAEKDPVSPWLDTTTNPVPSAKNQEPVAISAMDPFLYEGVSGVAMFLFFSGKALGDTRSVKLAAKLFESCLVEIKKLKNLSVSGFTGTSSVVYAIHKCKIMDPDFGPTNADLEAIVYTIKDQLHKEKSLDVLGGVAGAALALLHYTQDTASKTGERILRTSLIKLKSAANEIIDGQTKLDGMNYIRGFSHGVSGLALSIFRLARHFGDESAFLLVKKLLLVEFELTLSGGWTDEHTFQSRSLSAWCHGSAGIMLSMHSMLDLVRTDPRLTQYFELAKAETANFGVVNSQCLCHGSAGNAAILRKVAPDQYHSSMPQFPRSFVESLSKDGFESMDAAQTLGCGLMTGITGAGYFLLSEEAGPNVLDFLTLN